MPASSSRARTRRLPSGTSTSPTPSTFSFGIAAPGISRSLQLAGGLRDVGFVEERVAIADHGLRDQHLGLRRHAGHLLDRGANGHDLDVAAAHLVDVQLDSDDAVSADLLRLGADVLQGVGAGLVDELGHGVDLAAREAAEPGADTLAQTERID